MGNRDGQFTFRLAEEDRKALEGVATAAGMSVAAWIRLRARDEHNRTRDKEAAAQLSDEELLVAAKMGLRAHEYWESKMEIEAGRNGRDGRG